IHPEMADPEVAALAAGFVFKTEEALDGVVGRARHWGPEGGTVMQPIYLDYNATTPLDPAVLDALLPYLREHFGNPSSTHVYGKTAHDAVEQARQQVADLLGARPDEIVFTGGGTEASNHALKGAVFAKLRGIFGRLLRRDAHIITSAVEHPATLEPCKFLQR